MRFMILREIDQGIVRAREEAGLPPFEDSMPFTDGAAPTVFEVIKQFLLDDGPAAPASLDPTAALGE
jgi:hypothetical protein